MIYNFNRCIADAYQVIYYVPNGIIVVRGII